jgi:lipid A disaccharide synthetase
LKRSSYFISARSASADILASELVLAMNDQFPKVECLGIFGEWSGRTRSSQLGNLQTCLNLGLHDKAQMSEAAKTFYDQLIQELEKNLPQVAILVGYSFLHHELAGFFKAQNVPVVLYEITPVGAIKGIDFATVGQRLEIALGISPMGSELVQKSGVPYYYIGSPHKDRVDRVIVEAPSLGLSSQLPIVSIFPGGRVEGFQATFPVFQQLAEKLSQDKGVQVVLSVADQLIEDASIKFGNLTLKQLMEQGKTKKDGLRVMPGMHLELLSLSTLAIAGCGAITMECGLFQVPVMPIYPSSMPQNGLRSLLNQTVGKAVVNEYGSDTPADQLLAMARKLISAGPERDKMLKDLLDVKLSLQGFAAENAADYIGREIGQWKQGKRAAKGNKTA